MAAWIPSLLSFPDLSSQHFFLEAKVFSILITNPRNPPMKVPQKMAATLPDGNGVNEAILLKHPTTKSSSRKSKFKVYRKQNSDKHCRINVKYCLACKLN